MSETLQWNNVDQLGIGKITQNVNDLTKQVVIRQIEEVGAKLKMLQTMGIVSKDNGELKKILIEIEKLRTKS